MGACLVEIKMRDTNQGMGQITASKNEVLVSQSPYNYVVRLIP